MKNWRNPTTLLFIMAAAMPFSLGLWMAMINNFAVEQASFNGADIGLLQSIREIPGFLSFTVVFLLVFIREQSLVLLSLLLLGIGTAITGYLPSFWGLCFTTLLMSFGFHYFEAVNQSLQLQWLGTEEAPRVLGKLVAVGSASSLAAYCVIYLGLEYWGWSQLMVFLIGGLVTAVLAIAGAGLFPHFPSKVEQHKTLILRKRYWLYYALVFMSGARRQIFMVFAGFLMVEKFGFSASDIALMYIANMLASMVVAPQIGKLIGFIGERRTLMIEYVGLALVFVGYALVESAELAVALYIIDHLFFAMAIALKTYFQKIADPADIAPTAGVSFSINHIAAVAIPASFGLIWLHSPAFVFYAGAVMAVMSLGLSLFVPRHPATGNETALSAAA